MPPLAAASMCRTVRARTRLPSRSSPSRLILALDRRIADNVADLRAGTWNKKEYAKARGLYGRTLGLLGFGSIGQEVARRAQAFGMPVFVWSRRFATAPAAAWRRLADDLEVDGRSSPEEVAARTDVLSVHLALANETRALCRRVDSESARRGRISSIRRAVRSSTMRRLPMRSRTRHQRRRSMSSRRSRRRATGEFTDPLIGLPGVIGTHHIGASTDQAQEAIAAEAVRMIRAYKDTGKVPNVVNLATKTPATHMLVVRHRDRPGCWRTCSSICARATSTCRKRKTSFSRAPRRPSRASISTASPPADLLKTIDRATRTF